MTHLPRKISRHRESALLTRDLERFAPAISRLPIPFKMPLIALLLPRFGVLYWHRTGRILRDMGLHRLGYIAYLLNFYLNGVDFSPASTIGARCEFSHPNGVVIGGATNLYSGVIVQSSTTFGTDSSRRGMDNGYPRIGRRVYVGSGARIIGRISVGDGAVIGANSLVARDVPSGFLALGVPARHFERFPTTET